jgi:Icc-related predicted phosphoesterase
MKVVAISDTHNKHNALKLPEGDMLIHAGDVSGQGKQSEVENFLKWFSEQPHKHKIFIAGNHDFFFERMPEEYIASMIPDNVIYLNDSGVSVNGVNIWGSPVQPWFYDWAFNRQRGVNILQHWDLIPINTDILITHGPAHGILDQTQNGTKAGCVDLLNTVKKIRPKFSICGHIHEAYGQEISLGTTFINASVLDLSYQLVNKPIVFEI